MVNAHSGGTSSNGCHTNYKTGVNVYYRESIVNIFAVIRVINSMNMTLVC
ncbi:YHYH domain-containing protein [Photobacterium piscicola]|nr:YHYH domain-containing protein [Photobacterium piscicola]